MATIIQGGPDLRFAVLEQGVSRGVENYFQERERAKKEQKFLDAFRSVNAATNYDDAVKAMGLVDKELLANPQALQTLSEHIQRRFPAQEAVQVDTGTGIETVAVRKGDVAGALGAAEARGGRLAQDTEIERARDFQDIESSEKIFSDEFERRVKAKKLTLEERRTAAAELRARASAMRAKEGKGPSEKDKELARVTAAVGGDAMRAARIVDGLETMDIDPHTGEARIKDQTTGRIAYIPAENASDFTGVPSPKDGQALWNAALAGTGPVSALRAGMALPAAYFGVFEPKKTIEARQRLATSVQGFIRAVANSERFPVAEQERIRKEFGLGSSVWVHPETLRRRMVTMHQDLSLRADQANRDANDHGLPGEDRASAKRDAKEIRNFLTQMGVPEEHRLGIEQETSEQVPDIVRQNYPSVTFEQWQRLSPENKRRLQEQ